MTVAETIFCIFCFAICICVFAACIESQVGWEDTKRRERYLDRLIIIAAIKKTNEIQNDVKP